MSVHGPDAGRRKPYRAVWRDGRQRTMRFATEPEAIAFNALSAQAKSALADGPAAPTPVAAAAGPEQLPEGVFAYATGAGTRYRYNAAGTTHRGFRTPEEALKDKGAFLLQHARGEVVVGRMYFEVAWARYLTYKDGRISDGAHENLERDGRLHILPFFTGRGLQAIDGALVEKWVQRAGQTVYGKHRTPVGPKTVNNWRTQLHGFFEWCRSRPDIPVVLNPCEFVEPLTVDEREMAFLALLQIPVYYDCCTAVYRPLAKFLIATGARVSEAIAVRIADVDFEARVVRIYRQRDRQRHVVGTRETKGKRYRVVPLSDDLIVALRDLLALRAEHERRDDGWLFVCPAPARGRHAGRTEPVPPHRKTVNDWHEAALAAFNERRGAGEPVDVTLHGLRHTAAAAWLATGRPLYHVQKLLGHRSPETTQRYAHLELDPLRSSSRIEVARLQAIAAGLLV
jgi:integrase